MKDSVWPEDNFNSQIDDPEFIEQKKKDKILKMIKNAHVEKLKNYIFLKEINNAYYEMIRLSQEGQVAEAKEMERELNIYCFNFSFISFYFIKCFCYRIKYRFFFKN